jgi:hypothetical protein
LSCATSAELFIVFPVSEVSLLALLATPVAASMLALLATLLTLAGTSRRLLAKLLALVMASATHVFLEIVVLHSVICHVFYPPMCPMIDGSTGVSNDIVLRPIE